MKETKKVQRTWQESVFYWEKNRSFTEKVSAPITDALIENAQIHPGNRVLDLAGGIGEPSLTIAGRHGDSVKIIFTDIVQGMILAARNEAISRKIESMQFCRCSGDHLPFKDGSFDVIVSRLGVMFFADINRALKEMIRVLTSSGRVSFAVWHKRSFNPMHEIITKVVEEFIPSTPEPPDAPGGFRFSDEGKLTSLMKDQGFGSVNEKVLDYQMEEPIDFAEFWRIRSEMSDDLRDKLIQLSDVQMNQLYQRLEEEFAPYFVTGKLNLPARILLVSGSIKR